MSSLQLDLNLNSSLPLYRQVADQIQNLIFNEELLGEDALPSIREMASSHKISIITVQKAYDLLVQRKFIATQRGKGFTVNPIEPTVLAQIALYDFKVIVSRAMQEGIDRGLAASAFKRAFQELLTILEKNSSEP